LNGSGVGVITAPMTNARRNAKRRCLASHCRVMTWIFTSAKIATGTSNTRPIPRMKIVTNER